MLAIPNQTLDFFCLIFKVIDNVKNHCVYINLWIAGEPLLNPELEKMVEYANKQNIITCISTNAMLLTKERTKNLIAAGVDRVIISFDGATKESYEKIISIIHCTLL